MWVHGKKEQRTPTPQMKEMNLKRNISRSLSDPSTPRRATSICFKISFTFVSTFFFRNAWRMFSQSPAAKAERTKSPGSIACKVSKILSACLLWIRCLWTLYICARRTKMFCTVAANSFEAAHPAKSLESYTWFWSLTSFRGNGGMVDRCWSDLSAGEKVAPKNCMMCLFIMIPRHVRQS